MIKTIIDNLFHSSYDQLPATVNDDLNSYPEVNQAFFQSFKMGRNMMMPEHNKYLFRLLQIFGFKDEMMLSLFDKEIMKERLHQAINENKFEEKTLMEQFVVTHCL